MNHSNPSPPSFSLTPSNLTSESLGSSTRTRSRAGTLPSTFLNSNLPVPVSGAGVNSNSNSTSTSPVMTTTAHPDYLTNEFDIPMGSGRRMRSGSLFSTNSIWNDDNISVHSQNLLDNSTPNSFISPTLGAQVSTLHNDDNNDNDYNAQVNNLINRNRSYTTNAAIPGNIMLDNSNHSRLAANSYIPNNNNDINLLLDSLVNNNIGAASPNTRNRAQTFSGIPQLNDDYNAHLLNRMQQQVAAQQAQAQAQAQAQQFSQYNTQPVLLDDYDLSLVIITNNFENPNLGPTNYLLFDNLPNFFNSQKLFTVLSSSVGSNRSINQILSIKTTTTSTSKLSLVECASVEIAMNLKAIFNHFEIVPGILIYIAFAKCQERSGSNGSINRSPTHEPVSEPIHEATPIGPTKLVDIQSSLLDTINKIVGDNKKLIDLNKVVSILNKSLTYPNENYQDNFGPLPDPIPIRHFDAPKLRELRKDLEFNELLVSNGQKLPDTSKNTHHSEDSNRVMSQTELEELCLAMLDELPELCYDYIGNTIVQKLFYLVKSPLIKLMMVKEITPFLTQLSIHKNGTWAIQKIINLCSKDYQQEYLIGASLKPYTVKLFNDQFGNYVLQGCIKFESPFNDFIFESILDNFMEISFGRFGSRSIRTILETSDRYITKEQVALVSGLIIEFANELVINNNGSLLITWFLDTFNGFGNGFEKKYELLTNKFINHLDQLCCHKLANLTILKILNNRQDLKLKQFIMDKIFGTFEETSDDQLIKPPSKLLEIILTENLDSNFNAGPLFIYKILSNPLLLNITSYANGEDKDLSKNSRYQKFITQQIRRLLLEINITNFQPYKKLMDEVGLSNTRVNRSSSLSKRTNNGTNGVHNNGGHNNGGHNNGSNNGKRNGNMRQNNFNGNINNSYNSFNNMNYMQQPMINNQINTATYNGSYPPSYGMMPPPAVNYGYQQPPETPPQSQQEFAVMQQLEQLSLSSAAMGYNSNPGTPNDAKPKQSSFF